MKNAEIFKSPHTFSRQKGMVIKMNKIKRVFSAVLSVSLLCCTIPFTAVTVSAANSIKTQAEAVAWLNSQQDAEYNFDGAYGTQCTEFVKAYVNYLMTGNPWTNCGYVVNHSGGDVWKSSFWAENGWTVYENTPDFLPQPGDIFSAGLSGHGHTGVVISSDIYTAVIAEANGRDDIVDNGDPVWIRTINWRGSDVNSPYGATHYIRPNFASGTHVHSYNTFVFFWKSHPHYNCYKCSCGDIEANTAEPIFYDLCEECLKTVRPEKTALETLKNNYLPDEAIDFVWKQTQNTTHFNIWFYRFDGTDYVFYEDIFEYKDLSLSKSFPEGSYRVRVDSYNSNYWEADKSDWLHTSGDDVYFSVTSNNIWIIGDVNGDGSIDTRDIVRLMKKISEQDVFVTDADINRDGKVDAKDIVRLMKIIADGD